MKIAGVCPFPNPNGQRMDKKEQWLIWRDREILVKKCWLTPVLALLLGNGGGADQVLQTCSLDDLEESSLRQRI